MYVHGTVEAVYKINLCVVLSCPIVGNFFYSHSYTCTHTHSHIHSRPAGLGVSQLAGVKSSKKEHLSTQADPSDQRSS